MRANRNTTDISQTEQATLYHLPNDPPTPSRTAWTRAIDAYVASHEPHSTITWKHGLFNGPFRKCPCEPCRAKAAPPCPGCGGEHPRGLHLYDDREHSLSEDNVEQWRIRKELFELDREEGIEVDEETMRRVARGWRNGRAWGEVGEVGVRN